MLTDDHRAVGKRFNAFKRAASGDVKVKVALAQRACEESTVRTILEEELLYPAAQAAVPAEDRLDVEEA